MNLLESTFNAGMTFISSLDRIFYDSHLILLKLWLKNITTLSEINNENGIGGTNMQCIRASNGNDKMGNSTSILRPKGLKNRKKVKSFNWHKNKKFITSNNFCS